MGLSDIFNDSPIKKDTTPAPAGNAASQDLSEIAIDVPAVLSKLANEAAMAADNEVSATARLKAAKAKFQAEMDAQLGPLKEELASAREASKATGDALRVTMDAAGVTKVPMPDRKPIQIKTKLGAKKSITKTWLKTTLGDDQAESLWNKVPRQPDTRVIEVPRPYDDQPND